MERYEAYKDSGVEWIGEIPANWELRRVESCITSIESGVSVNAASYPAENDEVGVLKTSAVYHGVFNALENKHVNTDELDRVKCPVRADRLIVSRMNTPEWVGACGYVAEDHTNLYLPDRLWEIATCDSCLCKYAYYWLQCDGIQSWIGVIAVGTSGSMKNIAQNEFGLLPIPSPTLREQHAITSYLDAKTAEIDALVSDCEREVGLLQEYRKAVISEAVTKGLDPNVPMKDSGIGWIGEIPDDWEVVGFKTYLSDIIDYRGRTPEKVDDGVFLITGRNIKQGRIHYDLSQEYMRPEDFDTIMSRGRLKVGNVLFTMEAPLGEVALIDRDDCAAAQRIIQLCCNEYELFGAFLVYWIMSDGFQSDLQTYATGSTASGIKASKLGMLRLMHPPMVTQRSIVNYLDAKTAEIDSLIEAKQSMADKLREYRRSLISEAVTGKFKVPGA